MNQSWQTELLQRAAQVSRHAYAPYSRFAVGAAVLTADGQVFTGVNVENASYGLTICAEQNAVTTAVAAGHRALKAVAVWAENTSHHAVQPCGACRQVLLEFLPPEGQIITCHPQSGAPEIRTMAQVLPAAFDLPLDQCTDNS